MPTGIEVLIFIGFAYGAGRLITDAIAWAEQVQARIDHVTGRDDE